MGLEKLKSFLDAFVFQRKKIVLVGGAVAILTFLGIKFLNKLHRKQQKKLQPFIISGPSGCGKGTLLGKLCSSFPGKFSLSVSYTTRAQRPGEINGTHYHFVTKEEFEKEIEKGNFIEYVETFGNYYGTNRKLLDEISDTGKIPILEIDVKGAIKILKYYPHAKYLFINVPSMEELRRRLAGRKTETEEQINKRMKTAEFEISTFKGVGVYYELMNNDLETCFKEMVNYLRKEYPGNF